MPNTLVELEGVPVDVVSLDDVVFNTFDALITKFYINTFFYDFESLQYPLLHCCWFTPRLLCALCYP